MGQFSRCGLSLGLLLWATGVAVGADTKEKRELEAEISKLRGQVTLLVKKLPANYRYAPPDAAAEPTAAVTELRALEDPLLPDAIFLMFPREKRPDVRALFVELFAAAKPTKIGFLVRTGVEEPEKKVRDLARATWDDLDAVDVVVKANHFFGLIDEKAFYSALDALNDSGVLDRLPAEPGPRLAEPIRALIKRLYRADKSLVPVDSVQTAQNGNASRRVQRRDAAVVTRPVPDPVVHSVLTRIAKEDFGYDQEKWDRWYAVKYR